MTGSTFRALVLRQLEGGRTKAALESLSMTDLPDDDVLVRVTHSSLNYKDGLAVTGRGKIARIFPLVLGIDLAGEVVESRVDAWTPGDRVVATGWGLGEERFGGWAAYARVASHMLTRIPDGRDAAWAMAVGTAGFTAMLAVVSLQEHGVRPEHGPVVVTGASGGVGSAAVRSLSAVGYEVVAATGRTELEEYQKSLGASRVLSRAELARPSKPLESDRWAGAIDSIGGETLATVLSQTKRAGAVASCGLAGGMELNTTVFPFILRGVSLLGIDSNFCPSERRDPIWNRLATVFTPEVVEILSETIGLDDVPEWSRRIMDGEIRGRTVVRIDE